MNTEILDWMRRVVDPLLPDDARVLEIGSRNFNGSAREALQNRNRVWIGLDRQPGEGVDHVVDACDYLATTTQKFDCIVSSSAYEHDPLWWRTHEAARRALKRGGHYVVTTPSIGFPYHPDYGGDFYRFTRDTYLKVFFDGMHVVDLCEQVPSPLTSVCGIAQNIAINYPADGIPVFAYTLVSRPWKPWLRFWMVANAWLDGRFVLVIDNDPECIEIVRRLGGMPLTRASGAPSGLWDWYRQLWQHAAGHMHSGRWPWYLCTDVDEIFDIRYSVRSLAEEVAATGNIYCWAEMLSHVPIDGQPRPLPTSGVGLFDDFPVEVRMHELLRGGIPTKPVLRRCDMTGLHDLEDKRSRRWHDPRRFALHHFDFCTEAIATVEQKIARNQGSPLVEEYEALHLALINGIDVNSAPRRLPRDRFFRERTPDLRAF